MKSPDEINHAVFCAPPYLFTRMREALLTLSEKLFVIEERFKGELGTDARVIWLFAHEPDPRTPRDLRAIIGEVTSVLAFLENWSDCVKSGSPSTDEEWEVIRAADDACEHVKTTLHAFVDHLREVR